MATAVGTTCVGTQNWAYDVNPGICTASTCCQRRGGCVGVCMYGKSATAMFGCAAQSSYFSRLCYCVAPFLILSLPPPPSPPESIRVWWPSPPSSTPVEEDPRDGLGGPNRRPEPPPLPPLLPPSPPQRPSVTFELVAMGAATDGVDGFNLAHARSVATFVIESAAGTSTLAIVASASGVQILDVSNPHSLRPMGAASDGVDGFDVLNGANGISIFSLRGSTFAAVSSYLDNGVQIIDVSDPTVPVAVGAAINGADGFSNLKGPTSVAAFVMGARTFVIVTGFEANGVQIIDVSDPQHPLAMGTATDGVNGFSMLSGAHGVATFTNGTGTFAIVASYDEKGEQDYGVQLINVTDPQNPVAIGAASNGVNGFTALAGCSSKQINSNVSVSIRTYSRKASHTAFPSLLHATQYWVRQHNLW